MRVLLELEMLGLQALNRLGLVSRPSRIVYRWVTDAETGRLFCIWLPQEAAEATRPARQAEDEPALRAETG